MTNGRRLSDTLQKFREAREDLIREMGLGQPLASAEAGRQATRLRDLHDMIQIMKAAVDEAADVHAGRETRDDVRSIEVQRRVSALDAMQPRRLDDFRPL